MIDNSEDHTASSRPLVSVILPTYNRATYLRDALDSVFDQTYPEMEVIVIDDASTDDTPKILQEYHNRIQYIRNDTRQGVAISRNRGIRHSSGSLIALQDSDDIWAPNKLSLQVHSLTGEDNIGLVGGGVVLINSNGEPIAEPNHGPSSLTYEECAIQPNFPGGTSNALIPRRVLENVGLFDPQLLRNQDRDLWIRIAKEHSIHCVPHVTLFKRCHDVARPDMNINTVRECRLIIDSRIDEPLLRIQAYAWTWFRLFIISANNKTNKRVRSLAFLTVSALTWPGPIQHAPSRTRMVVRRLIPEEVRDKIHSILRTVFPQYSS